MDDLENGLWAGNETMNGDNTPIDSDFVTGILKGNSGNHWAIKGGGANDARLKTLYDGERPKSYRVMKKQGGIILGIGGDSSNRGGGTFYEGVIVAGFTHDDKADEEAQANIQAFQYQNWKLEEL